MALKGKQKKLDKNNNGRIDAEDFKILQGSKKGMRMGGMAGYGSARTSGMGLQDESMKPGKVMKANTGKQVTKGRGMTKGDLEYAEVRSKHPRSKKYDKPGYSPVFKSAREESENTVKVQRIVDDLVKKKGTKDIDAIGYLTEGRATAREGSFKKGSMIKARSGTLAESMKKLREKAYEKSGKKMKGVGRYGKDEYMIQKKLPGMKTGKYVFDMVGVKPMSGLNKDKKTKDYIKRRLELGSLKSLKKKK